MWKVEGCFEARIDPWRPAGRGVATRRRSRSSHASARGCSSPRATAARTATGAIYGTRRAALPALRRRRSARAGRATTTARPTGARVPGVTLRVGHKGADHIAPGQHARVVRRRARAGVDMIEFDVLPEDHRTPATSRLLLAHDYAHARGALTLERGARPPRRRARSRASSSTSTSSCRATRRAWSTRCARTGSSSGRSISTLYMRSLVALRELEPRLRLGWSVPRVQARLHDARG